ncbi:MAG: hypothetical protein KDB03_14940 [Planctomycetales bacterium]|nr:hypothetical protein [Planctomycetales bacterium]
MNSTFVAIPSHSARLGCASPFARWNLRRNPFGELSFQEREVLAQIVSDDVEPFVTWARSKQHSHRRVALQFVADCGYGKTSHLLGVRRLLGDIPYVYFPEHGKLPNIPPERPLLVDELQRLRWWHWRDLVSKAGLVVLGSHVDYEVKLRRYGFSVLTVDLQCPKSAPFLAKVLNARIAASEIAPEGCPRISVAEGEWLLAQFGSNVRQIENYLYEVWQRELRSGKAWPKVF